jgi:hypothetical protein
MYVKGLPIVSVPSRASEWSCMFRIYRLCPYQAGRVSSRVCLGFTDCVRAKQGGCVVMYVKDLPIVSVPSRESEWSCMFRIYRWCPYQAGRVSGHVC